MASTSTTSPAPQHVASMILPQGGKVAWTQIMQGGTAVPDQINAGSPIVLSQGRFDDGTLVVGGVYKSDTPTDYNVKFMWVFDGNGNQYPGWPIDVSDDEDFMTVGYAFSLTEQDEPEYLLNIVESGTSAALDTNDYLFNVSLFDASQNPSILQVWQSGTFEMNLAGNPSVSGVLSLPGYYSEPIPFSGQIQPPDSISGTIVTGGGQSSQVQITVTFEFNYDGFLYDGTYIAGLVSMLDFSAQETYLYVLQGLSPSGPFGKQFRGGSKSADKRKPSVS